MICREVRPLKDFKEYLIELYERILHISEIILNESINFVMKKPELLSLILTWIIIIFIGILLLKLVKNIILKIVRKIQYIKRNGNVIIDEYYIYSKSGMFTPKYVADFFETVEFGWKNFLDFFLQVGFYLCSPANSRVRKSLFGKILSIDKTKISNEVKNDISITILDVIIIAGKISKLIVKVENTGEVEVSPQINKSDKISNFIKLSTNLGIECSEKVLPTNLLRFTEDRTKNMYENPLKILPGQEVIAYIYFPILKRKQIKEIKEATLYIKFKVKHGKYLDYNIQLPITEKVDVEETLKRNIDIGSIYAFLGLGGYFVFLIPLSFLIYLILSMLHIKILFWPLNISIWFILFVINIKLLEVLKSIINRS